MDRTPWDAIAERLLADSQLAEERHQATLGRMAEEGQLARQRHQAMLKRMAEDGQVVQQRHHAMLKRMAKDSRLAEERHLEAGRLAEERHRHSLAQAKAGERVFIAAFSDIDANIQRNTDRLDDLGERLDDMGESIRANTRAVLSVLDRMDS